MKYCQGPQCHQYKTKDRIRGPKGAKVYQTRRRSQLMYDSFCSQRCADDWFTKFGQRAVITSVEYMSQLNSQKKMRGIKIMIMIGKVEQHRIGDGLIN